MSEQHLNITIAPSRCSDERLVRDGLPGGLAELALSFLYCEVFRLAGAFWWLVGGSKI